LKSSEQNWYAVDNVGEIASPGLLIYPDRVEENLRRIVSIAGGTDRLRPHIKTHKMPAIMELQLRLGISKFKCATIAEAEMAAQSGARDVLLAYQLVGPNVARWVRLLKTFPQTNFTTIADDDGVLNNLSRAAAEAQLTFEVLLDIDVGQHRCGIAPGKQALELYRSLSKLPGLRAGGIHAYDGHLHDSDAAQRKRACESAFAPVWEIVKQLRKSGADVPQIVAGGTPTFPFHAQNPQVECSPGTCVLWDHSYTTKLPDVDFLPAALVLTRVISKPDGRRLCLDLGHKAIASENPHPRVYFLNLPDAVGVSHSEEHLVVESDRAAELAVGDVLYGVPWHICPTVALHSSATLVRNRKTDGVWKTTARERVLSI